MSRQAAKAFYDLQQGDPATGYITPADAQAALDVVYDDMAAQDTGLRSVPVNGAGWTGNLLLRRYGPTVTVQGEITAPAAGSDKITDLPAGFHPASGHGYTMFPTYNLASGLYTPALVGFAGDVNFYGVRTAGQKLAITATFTTPDPWPTSLPGTAV